MNPYNDLMQQYPQPAPNTEWTGDCWKAWVKLRKERNDLEMKVVDSDYGCGIITFGNQQPINLEYNPYELNYNFLDVNRQKLLNLITCEEFKKLL